MNILCIQEKLYITSNRSKSFRKATQLLFVLTVRFDDCAFYQLQQMLKLLLSADCLDRLLNFLRAVFFYNQRGVAISNHDDIF